MCAYVLNHNIINHLFLYCSPLLLFASSILTVPFTGSERKIKFETHLLPHSEQKFEGFSGEQVSVNVCVWESHSSAYSHPMCIP